MQKMLIAISAVCVAFLAGQVRADDDPPVKPAPKPEVLDATYHAVRQHVDDVYIGKLPNDWASWQSRFDGKLTSTGALRAVLDTMLSSPSDLQLRILKPKQVELYKCRSVSGYVGIGVEFKSRYILHDGFPIEKVIDDSPARAANVTSGWTIVAIDGTKLAEMEYKDALSLLLGKGTTVKLTLRSGEQEKEVTIQRKEGQKLGIQFARGKTILKETVERVMKNSPAEVAGIKVGEEITHVNGNQINNADPSWFTDQATYGELGTKITLTVTRDGKPVTLELNRAIVENHDLAYSFTLPDQGDCTLRLTNLDWTKLVETVDSHIASINERGTCTIDLRGASGDDPEIAARLAARFIISGTVLVYHDRRDGQVVEHRYVITQNEGKATLSDESVEHSGKPNDVVKVTLESTRQVEQPSNFCTAKLTVLVDARTSGTAEALVRALQKIGKATVSGTTTAGRKNLVSTKLFTADDTEFFVEVPVRTLTANDGGFTTVSPDKLDSNVSGPAFLLVALVVIIGGALLLLFVSIRASLRRSEKPTNWKAWLAALLATTLVTATVWYYFGGSILPKNDAQKAAAYVNNILRTDETVLKEDFLQYARVQRGDRDTEPKFGEQEKGIAPAEVEAASRAVTALTEGDVDAMRKIVVSYVYMPYARAQIGSSLNYTFYLAGVDCKCMWYGSKFGFGYTGLLDGQFGVNFSPLDEAPEVTLMVKDPKYPRQFETDKTDLVTAKEVLNALRLSIIRDALAKQAEGTR